MLGSASPERFVPGDIASLCGEAFYLFSLHHSAIMLSEKRRERKVLKRLIVWLCALMLFAGSSVPALAEDTILEPVCPVPQAAAWLLEVASEEVGYREGDHGWSKYGEWAGDPYCQWCAEFLCWCAEQVDLRHGTSLLGSYFPRYSGSNTGRAWFIKAGRFAVRNGEVEGWGYEWLRGEREFLKTGSYIPQPGDYVFFTWRSGEDTDHVALVEYCSRDAEGNITIHVIEGNNPVGVARNEYPLSNTQILGYGTASDLVDITMRFGNQGEKVRQLQSKLIYLGYLDPSFETGRFGNGTADAVRQFQTDHGLKPNSIANVDTQLLLDEEVDRKYNQDPATWLVVEDEED